MSARLERILASIGTPAHIDQETPRETILALEVRRLRAERDAMRAERAAMKAKVNDARVDAESHHRQTSSSYHEGQLDTLDLVQQWLEAAGKEGGA